jgi:uncharacterized SAM-dependent methyltransferase
MQYFRNSELAKRYRVHPTTVAKWIEAAADGKLKLALHQARGRSYVANTSANVATIDRLVADRKKFVNRGGRRVVRPPAHLYENYSNEQIADIMSNLTSHREIPTQYSYVDGGASYWDVYAHRLIAQNIPSTLTSTILLLESNLDNLDRLLAGHRRVNVIDLGVGNALPIRGLLAHLVERGALGRYIAIDISTDMLKIAGGNITRWFGDSVSFEAHQRDLSSERFRDLIADDFLAGDEAVAPVNLVLLLGGTLSNFRDPDDVLRNIHNSMMPGDLFLHSLKLDTPQSRQHFDSSNLKLSTEGPASRHTRMLEQLGIDESCYEIETNFDEQLMARFVRARLKVALSIEFTFGKVTRHVELNKDDRILLLRIWHRDVFDVVGQLARTGFGLLQASQTSDHEYLLTVSDLNADTNADTND